MRQPPTSAVIWHGPSAFNSQPVVAVVTGLRRPSANPKTGPMAQVWVIRADVEPVAALAKQFDYSVCGDCPLRRHGQQQRVCYVNPKTPQSIYWAWRAGRYPELDPAAVNDILRRRRLAVRLGAYGEMTALPVWVTAVLTAGNVRWTGYTHQWREKPLFRPWLMASVESSYEAAEAQAMGWRTFRILAPWQTTHRNEVVCPASAEAGHKTTCLGCGLCNGQAGQKSSWPNVAIVAHGAGAGRFVEVLRRKDY